MSNHLKSRGLVSQEAREVKTLREAALERIWSDLGPGSDALALCSRASEVADDAARACWRLARMPECCALVAVGGFGRAALWPGSDVDMMALAPSEDVLAESDFEEAVGRLAAHLWDAGLEPALAARRVGQCARLAEQDTTIRCAMMERRLLCGDPGVFDALGALMDALDPLPFYLAKMREQRDRHERYGDSPFGLEPNLKEAPGGLRDLQMPMWVARSMGLRPSWSGLVEEGLLTGGEAELASACEARLALLRALLHRTGSRGDLLDFQAQEALAAKLGIGAEEGKPAAAVMMEGFFACARSAVMINEVLLQGLCERLLDSESGPKRVLSERFYEQGGLLWAASESVFAREPSALFEAFEWMQRDPGFKGMGSRSTRALWRAGRRVDAWFRADQRNREAFVRMLSAPRAAIAEVGRMARVGLLGAYIPAFGKAETLMQHDLFHAFTVGRHTLGAMRFLRRFEREDRAHEMPLASEIASGFERYWLLYAAALFHDLGKGRGGRHEELGAAGARVFCQEHGILGDDADLVEFAVRSHLEMSKASQKEDIQDPEVVERFARLCKTPRRLDALYLLTVADMKATGASVWSDWKGRLLESLWGQAHAALSGQWEGSKGKASKMRALAVKEALGAGANAKEARAYAGLFDDLYYLRTSPQDCSWHARVLSRADRSAPACVVDIREGKWVHAMVWSKDREGLFLHICSALSRAGLGIHSAKLASSKSGWAIDSFEASDSRPHEPGRGKEIEAIVLASIAPGAPSHKPALGRSSARAKRAGAIAEAHISKAGLDWLVEVACADRSGVLWSIAEELDARSLAVKSARVATVGERAEDVFVVEGARLESPEFRLEVESALVKRLGL